MQLQLSEEPHNPTIILGFPGLGLVGTIATEFLIEHLETEKIGKISVPELPAMIAIHHKQVVNAITIYYNKKYNIILVHCIAAMQGMEWKLAEEIQKLVTETGAKEILCLEGIGGSGKKAQQVYFFSNTDDSRKVFEKKDIPELDEGIIIGIAAAALAQFESPVSCVFVETSAGLPDSKAAAEVIKVLDRYLGLEVDYKPLLDQAKKFEQKLKNLLSSTQKTQDLSEKKMLNYVG